MQFALRICKISTSLPNTSEGRLVRNQLFRAGTSAGAQYREACRARSSAEFVSKMEPSQQELDETSFWLEFVERCGMFPQQKLILIRDEADQLIRIFAA